MRIATTAAVYALGAAFAMGASQAAAQTQTSPQVQAAPDQTPPDDASQVEEIVVTGSRITRRDYVSETPITTVSAEVIASAGATTLEASLNQLPQVTASAGSQASYVSRAGQASINLRGLGQQRTLVLVNGRRMQPSGSDGTVDLNVIPGALIDSVEVITGGASATYGSDAVAGVVNLKLKRHFNGVQFDFLAGITGEGDGANQSATVTLGSDFADDRGNAYVSLSYGNRDSVDYLDRDYLIGQALSNNSPAGLLAPSASNLPTQAAVNAVFARYGIAPGTVARTATLSPNTDATLFTNVGAVNFRGTPNSQQTLYNGTLYSAAGDFFLAQVPLERYSTFGHADYKLNDKISVFAEGLYTNYTVTTRGGPVVIGSAASAPISVPTTNPFISADLAQILASRPNPNAPFSLSQIVTPVGNRFEANRYDVFQLTLGAEGRFDIMDLSWNLYGTFGRTELLQSQINFPSSFAVQRLLSAADGGRSLCAGGYNFMNVNSLSAACQAYVRRTARNTTDLEQKVVEGTLQGRLATLPAGELRFAVGADYRSNTYAFAPDALVQTGELANTLGIQPSSGETSVKEVFGELLIPLLHELPLVQDLSLNLGYRYSDYDSVGGVQTYKADGYWQVNDVFALRGGYARAVRAPSVGDLFAAASSGLSALGAPGPIGSGDPCDVRSAYRAAGSAVAAKVRALCLAQGVPTNLIDSFTNSLARTPFTTAGNTDLQPEVSDTYSAGVVIKSPFQNPWLSRLTASIDYYKIKLDGAIGQVTNTVATGQCFSTAANPSLANSNFYCSLLTRDPATGQIVLVGNPLLNLGGYETSGVDVQADWSMRLEDAGLSPAWGTVSLGVVVNYLDTFAIQTLPTGSPLEYAGTINNTQIDFFATGHPELKATVNAGWRVGPVQTNLRWRYMGEMDNANNVGTGGTAHGVEAVSYYDFDAAWRINPALELRAGVVNLANDRPPVLNDIPLGVPQTDIYTYDIVGRRIFVALKANF